MIGFDFDCWDVYAREAAIGQLTPDQMSDLLSAMAAEEPELLVWAMKHTMQPAGGFRDGE